MGRIGGTVHADAPGETVRGRLRRERRTEERRTNHRDATGSEKPHGTRRAGTVIGAAAVLLVLLAFALVVGDADYRATLIGWLPLLSCLIAFGLAAGYVALLGRRVEVVQSGEAAAIVRGEQAPVSLALANASALPCFRARVHIGVTDFLGTLASERALDVTLGSHARQPLGFSVRLDHLGLFDIGVRDLEVFDFLGLFSRSRAVSGTQTVRVDPRVPNIAVRFTADASMESARPRRSVRADSLDYASVREYVPGDPLKTIHWKLSARAGQYQTRVFEMDVSPGVAVVVDLASPDTEAETLMGEFDALVESALGCAAAAAREGLEAELLWWAEERACSREVFLGMDPGAVAAALPSVRSCKPDTAARMLREQLGSRFGKNNLVVCSANFDAELVRALADAKRQRRAPLLVAVIPAGLTERERELRLAPLRALNEAGVPWRAVSDAAELAKGGLG